MGKTDEGSHAAHLRLTCVKQRKGSRSLCARRLPSPSRESLRARSGYLWDFPCGDKTVCDYLVTLCEQVVSLTSRHSLFDPFVQRFIRRRRLQRELNPLPISLLPDCGFPDERIGA